MVKDQDSPPSLDFQIDASSPSKRPEQFAALLDSALRRPLRRTPGGYGIRASGNSRSSKTDVAKRLTHAARAVFNDCMISPWY